MKLRFSERALREDFQGAFVKSILGATTRPDLISFAGGLPNPLSFPAKALEEAAAKVLEQHGVTALQYNVPQGHLPLREYIAARYEKMGVQVTAEQVLITNGSQQGVDLISSVLLNRGDAVAVERPSYLAALQVFNRYSADMRDVALTPGGVDAAELRQCIQTHDPKLFYAIPTFQNPTGLSYSAECRAAVVEALRGTDTLLLEDNPYGELRFAGVALPSMQPELGGQCVLLGTFSKIVSPGMRLGWVCTTNKALMDKMIDYKQIVDVHTNIFGQMILCQYLQDNDIEQHIEKIRALYQHQAETMMACMQRDFPADVTFTRPEGGMFLWATLPDGLSSVELGRRASAAGVVIAPGDPFYVSRRDVPDFRLNYTNCDDARIEEGVRRLAGAIREMRA